MDNPEGEGTVSDDAGHTLIEKNGLSGQVQPALQILTASIIISDQKKNFTGKSWRSFFLTMTTMICRIGNEMRAVIERTDRTVRPVTS